MKAYEICLVIAFIALTIILVWNGIRIYRQASHEQDGKLRKTANQNAIALVTSGIACLLCAFYILLRVFWLLFIVVLLGAMVFAYSLGSGLGENIKKHGK